MTRPLICVLSCFALVLSAAVGSAAAQDGGSAPQELWNEFTLEPTPAAAAPRATATPTPEVVRVERREGTSTGALIALVIVAGAVGGVVARLAARRLPRRRAKAATTNGSPPAAKPASTLPPRQPVRPATTNGSPAAAEPASAPPTPPRRPARPATTNGTPAAAEPDSTAPAPRRPPRRRVRATPVAPKASATQPRPPSASPPEIPLEPPRARRFEPAGADWEACAIKLQMRDAHGRFCAIAEGDPPVVLAYSPMFPLDRDGSGAGPAALKVLVEQLAAAGWQQVGTGKRPWDIAFRRPSEAPRAARR